MQAGPPTERSFSVSVGGVCVAFGALLWWRGRLTASVVLLALGMVLVTLGLVAPSLLRVPGRMWWRFAQTLGWVNSRILLTIFFLVVVTPVGVVMRAFGRNPLGGAAGSTNWRPYPARRGDVRHYERMF